MASPRGSTGADQKRAHPRVPTHIAAKLRLPDGSTQPAGEILNISLGGVFIETAEPLGFGTEIDIEFTVPDATIRCKGLIVWSTKSAPQRAGGRTGMGVRLMKIGVSEMRKLEAYIAGRLEGETSL
jgi:Tfp pilus assembly protein PilZ